MKKLTILLSTFAIAHPGHEGHENYSETNETDDEIACTQDVKECEDGSYVSRVAPTCEFEACPNYEEEDEIPEDCIKWFDGCNTCEVDDGEIMACTEKECIVKEDPKCEKYKEEYEKDDDYYEEKEKEYYEGMEKDYTLELIELFQKDDVNFIVIK
jgi:hypothetical protein